MDTTVIKKYILPGALATAGMAATFVLGWTLSKKKYEALFEAEIESVKDAFKPGRKEGIYATPASAVQALIGEEEVDWREVVLSNGRQRVEDLIQSNGYGSAEPGLDEEWARQAKALADEERIEDVDHVDIPDAETIVQSIWDNSAAQINPDAILEMPERDLDKPYVITYDQFMTDDIHEDNKISVLFFEEDGQLVDERETLIPNVEEILGEKNLTHFGLGSNDRNVVYIRNEKLDSDFEVVRDMRSFSEVVLGVKPARSNGALRKMRDNDE